MNDYTAVRVSFNFRASVPSVCVGLKLREVSLGVGGAGDSGQAIHDQKAD